MSRKFMFIAEALSPVARRTIPWRHQTTRVSHTLKYARVLSYSRYSTGTLTGTENTVEDNINGLHKHATRGSQTPLDTVEGNNREIEYPLSHLSGVTKSQFGAVKNPNAWIILNDDAVRATGVNIELYHPKTQQTLVLNRHELRDSCACDTCVDPNSGQKNFGTCDVPEGLPIEKCRRTENGDLEVVWQSDFLSQGFGAHTSRYPASRISEWFSGRKFEETPHPEKVLWDRKIFEKRNQSFDYKDWMEGGDVFRAAMAQYYTYGLVFLDNVPKSEQSVVTIANQIGNLQETFYGRTWDVRSKPEAENVALYTNSFLNLHQDLLYLRDTPQLQLLHCLENSCEGGESIFSDGLRAAQVMKAALPHLFKALTESKIRYHYNKYGHFYENWHSVLSTDGLQLRWSPPFQAAYQPPSLTHSESSSHSLWVAAAKTFRDLLEQENGLYEVKMDPGQCVLFDNLRVLHGRRKFDTSSGSRWLKGAYVASDVVQSKYLALRASNLHTPISLNKSDPEPLHLQALALSMKYRPPPSRL